jgi:CheY-like chemotaxis protein
MAAPAAQRQQTGLILVVDDEAPLRLVTSGMLQRLGFSTLEAADGEEALRLLEAHGDRIRAVMLDIYMPKLSGRETFMEMRKRGINTPVILCSGYIMDPDEFVLLSQCSEPPLDLIAKPYTPEILAAAMEHLPPAQAANSLLASRQTECTLSAP